MFSKTKWKQQKSSLPLSLSQSHTRTQTCCMWAVHIQLVTSVCVAACIFKHTKFTAWLLIPEILSSFHSCHQSANYNVCSQATMHQSLTHTVLLIGLNTATSNLPKCTLCITWELHLLEVMPLSLWKLLIFSWSQLFNYESSWLSCSYGSHSSLCVP